MKSPEIKLLGLHTKNSKRFCDLLSVKIYKMFLHFSLSIPGIGSYFRPNDSITSCVYIYGNVTIVNISLAYFINDWTVNNLFRT